MRFLPGARGCKAESGAGGVAFGFFAGGMLLRERRRAGGMSVAFLPLLLFLVPRLAALFCKTSTRLIPEYASFLPKSCTYVVTIELNTPSPCLSSLLSL